MHVDKELVRNTFSCETSAFQVKRDTSLVQSALDACWHVNPSQWNDERMKLLVAIESFACSAEHREQASSHIDRWIACNDGHS